MLQLIFGLMNDADIGEWSVLDAADDWATAFVKEHRPAPVLVRVEVPPHADGEVKNGCDVHIVGAVPHDWILDVESLACTCSDPAAHPGRRKLCPAFPHTGSERA